MSKTKSLLLAGTILTGAAALGSHNGWTQSSGATLLAQVQQQPDVERDGVTDSARSAQGEHLDIVLVFRHDVVEPRRRVVAGGAAGEAVLENHAAEGES